MAQAHSSARGAVWATLLVSAALQLIIGLGYFLRRTWPFPPDYYDQAVYLSHVYEITERVFAEGPLAILRSLVAGIHPQGILLLIEGAIAQTLAPGRLMVISINFAAFGLLQAALVSCIRHLTGSWGSALAGLGLLLSTATMWNLAGGIFDFRIDFIALCVYGIWVCFVLRSEVFLDLRWSLFAGVIAGALVLHRYFTIIFISVTIVTFLGVALAARLGEFQRRLENAIFSGVVTGALVAPLLIISAKAIHDYYIVGHVTGEEKGIRAAEIGISSFWQHAIYYPVNLVTWHLGLWFFVVAAVAVGWCVISRCHRQLSLSSAAFLACAIAMPILVLTPLMSKSPIVVGIVTVPAVLAVIVVFRLRLSLAGGIAVLICGLASLWLHSLQPSPLSRQALGAWAEGAEALPKEALARGLRSPTLYTDAASGHVAPETFTAFGYERLGEFVRFVQVGGGLFATTEEREMAGLTSSDFVILTAPHPEHVFPRYQTIAPFWHRLKDWADANLVRIGEYLMASERATFYAKPRATIAASGDWLIARGSVVRVDPRDAKVAPILTLAGEYPNAVLPEAPGLRAKVSGLGIDIPSRLSTSGERYEIVMDLRPVADMRSTGPILIELSFDRYFVPKERGINPDTRQLVVRAPDSIRMQRDEQR